MPTFSARSSSLVHSKQFVPWVSQPPPGPHMLFLRLSGRSPEFLPGAYRRQVAFAAVEARARTQSQHQIPGKPVFRTPGLNISTQITVTSFLISITLVKQLVEGVGGFECLGEAGLLKYMVRENLP